MNGLQLREHKCKFAPQNCHWCNELFEANKLSEHEDECKTVLVLCEACHEQVPRSELDDHDAICAPQCICGMTVQKVDFIAHQNMCMRIHFQDILFKSVHRVKQNANIVIYQ